MSYYKAYESLKQAYHQTTKVNQIFFGEPRESNMQNIYPCVFITPTPAQIGAAVVSVSFEVEVLDLCDFNNESIREQQDNANDYQDNLLDVLASTMNIHSQAVNIISRGDVYEAPLRIVAGQSATPIVREGKNNVAGWSLSYTIEFPAYGPIC